MGKLIRGLVMLFAFSTVCLAQNANPRASGDFLFDTHHKLRFDRGEFTWTAAANIVSPMGVDDAAKSMNVSASIGYFFTHRLEGEGCVEWINYDDASGLSISLGGNWYFTELFEKMYPYVGGGLAKWTGDYDNLGTRLRMKAGVRHYINEKMGFRYWAQFDTTPGDLLRFKGILSAYIGFFAMPF